MKNYLLILLALFYYIGYGQERDTLKLNITKIDKKITTDTVYQFYSRVDTIALQPVRADTSKMVKDVNPQDLEKSKYKVRIMGSVRVNAYYDLIGMNSTEGFLPYDIPIGEQDIPGLSSVYIGARQSRIGLEGTGNTKVGKIKTYIEVDFASSTSSFWRLRHAYAEWNFIKLGYTWTTFMDNSSLPTTVDFEGPNSSLSKRHGVIRYERKLYESNIVGISIEAPQTDYYNPADSIIINKNIQGSFDIAGRYKYINTWGHIQLAGIYRRIAYIRNLEMDQLPGWGVLLSTAITIKDKHSILAQYSVGEGIANYYVGFGGRSLDAIYNPNLQKMELKNIHGGFGTYTYIYNPKWRSSVTVGISYLLNKDFESQNSFSSSRYIAANTFFKPIETINIGFEFTTGTRVNNNTENGSATRFSVVFNFDF